jgi:RHS repeat-associated protein
VENNKTLGSYVYNAKGQRTIKATGPAATASASSQNTVYHYDLAGRLLEETAGDGKLLTDYVYLEGQPLAMVRKQASGEETFYYHNDHLGTPKVMTDKLGKVAWNVEFDPFGNEVSTGKNGAIRSVENNLRFPGQYFDAETSLHYNYFRDYNPRTGRYVEADPIGLNGGMNRFGYVQNNLTTRIDFFGLDYIIVSGGSSGVATYYDSLGNPVLEMPFRSGWGPNKNDPTANSQGRTPPGNYTIEKPPVTVPKGQTNQSSFCDKSGNCWWAPYEPQFLTPNNRCAPASEGGTGRCGLHPDGGGPGTAGCTGLSDKNTSLFRQLIRDFKPSKSNPLQVIVQ